ncbi:homoserine dehydrogenase [bacterium]|nr:homoserine dehydrogenase [bacterium]
MNIAILGYGVIGSGVKEITKDRVVKVFDLPIKKDIIGDTYTDSFDDILEDSSITTIVETMGGVDLPYRFIKEALKAHKNVVTSNKEVVSLHLDEFLKLAKENDVYFLFEASVGGGIPIINTLIENVKINDVNHIYGIMNGTTNFILSRIEEGMEFSDALALAKAKGFAEADPTNDLEGLDMVRKISILSSIAYHTFLDVNDCSHFGIKNISKEIIDFLKEKDYTVKFIAESYKCDSGIYLNVEPVLFKLNSLTASIKDEYNSITFFGSTNGKIELSGKGAGKYPTASAVISDIEKIKDENCTMDLNLSGSYHLLDRPKSKYFVYTHESLSKDLYTEKCGNYYFTKEIDLIDIKNPIFYARMNTYEEI